MFTTHSLQTLVNIAESEKLRPHLRHVYFITSSFSPRSLSCSHATCCCCWQPTTRQREAFIDYMRDQEKLRETNADRKLISNAFANLPGLRRVMLVDSLNSLADAPAECYCYGYNKVLRTTNKAPSFAPINETGYAEYFLWLSHVWQTVVGAVAESGIDSLTSFGTNFKSHTHGKSVNHSLTHGHSARQQRSCISSFRNISNYRSSLQAACSRQAHQGFCTPRKLYHSDAEPVSALEEA